MQRPLLPVAMLTSVRLPDERQRVVIGDCGLTDDRRRHLAPHPTLLPIPMERCATAQQASHVHRLVTTVVRRRSIRIVKPWLVAQLKQLKGRRTLARRALERRQPPDTRDA